ncbi:transcriptional regulator [Clostridium sp. WLY-B-L2]|uniref:Transcriptional regulator n=1 Tax=Clostridium aromativorans TaxID=2836848 RepID=A0ABS8N873_9CLOT|nr:transcriptional regulator [Clostridium aromativorans]
MNKWENGISYPDIMLLSPLARVLKIDVNTLLAFNEKLTTAEVNKLGKEVSEMVSKEGHQKAFERGSDLIRQYSSCDELILRISSILRLLLVTSRIEEKYKYEEKIITWIQFVAASSNEKTASMAKISLSAIYREKKEYEKAREILDRILEIGLGIDKKIQQALLFESSGKIEEAYDVYEEILLNNAHEALGAFSLIISLLLKENKFTEAEECTGRAKKLVEVFDLGAYRKYTLDLSLAREKQDKEKAIRVITNMVNEADSMNNFMKSKLYRHRKLKVTHSWSKDEYERLVKQSIKKDKILDLVKNDSRIKFLLK